MGYKKRKETLMLGSIIMGGAGAFTGYMASLEATENANNAAWANYLNQDHQARLSVQRQNDQMLQQYRKQTTQNLFIESAATAKKIRDKQSLKRSARAQRVVLQHQNKAAYDMIETSVGSRNIASSSGTSKALKRQALRTWQNSAAALDYNTKEQGQGILDNYQGMLNRRGSDVFMPNTYIGGSAPQMIDGTWAAINAGISGGIQGAQAGVAFN